MTRKIALLRGVNVGGNNKLPMKTLVSIFEKLGCENVHTYIQSGNAVFDGAASANDIADGIKKLAGFRPHVFVLTAAAMRKAALKCPFAKEAERAGKSVHLFFLDDVPSADSVNALGALKSPREDFAIMAKTLYLHAQDGLSASKIADRIDRTLKTTTIARNWNTVMALLEMTGGSK
ncbi:MAG: DUF1697 domain-containing protein [Pseudomonadota bacterium]